MCRMADRHNRFETGPVISPHHIVNKVLPVKVKGGGLSLSRRQVMSPGSSKRFGEKYLTYSPTCQKGRTRRGRQHLRRNQKYVELTYVRLTYVETDV